MEGGFFTKKKAEEFSILLYVLKKMLSLKKNKNKKEIN